MNLKGRLVDPDEHTPAFDPGWEPGKVPRGGPSLRTPSGTDPGLQDSDPYNGQGSGTGDQ
jgi:hypothetical protein